MKNNKKFIILVVIIALQLSVPLGIMLSSAAENLITKKYGEKIKFEIGTVYYHGETAEVSLITREIKMGNIYAYPILGENGLARAVVTDDKPDGNTYIKLNSKNRFHSFPYEIFVDKTLYDDAIQGYGKSSILIANKNIYYSVLWESDYDFYFDEGYVEAYVYKGNVEIGEVYIDGLLFEDYLKKINNQA